MVELEVLKGGGLDCHSDNCRYTRECANHETAGDFRMEDGMTPTLGIVDGKVVCYTYGMPPKSIDDYRTTSEPECDHRHGGALMFRGGQFVLAEEQF